MVIGSRFIEKEGFQSSFTRRLGIRYFTFLIKILTGQKITDPTSGYRMCNRKIIELFAGNYPKDYPEPETTTWILRKKLKVLEIPVIMRAREEGVSSISLKKSFYYMFKVTMAIIIGQGGKGYVIEITDNCCNYISAGSFICYFACKK